MIEVHVNFPTADEAATVARSAVERRLAAAANVHAPVSSHYWWRGALRSEQEIPVIFKTSDTRVDALIDFVSQHHSYETPGIVAHRPETASAAYRDWIEQETRQAAL